MTAQDISSGSLGAVLQGLRQTQLQQLANKKEGADLIPVLLRHQALGHDVPGADRHVVVGRFGGRRDNVLPQPAV